ncbi:MAG: 1-deoxy-D-xylulose-5-phosphate synthase N-terminal domain-containing protein [Patescibacteria group bacterium]
MKKFNIKLLDRDQKSIRRRIIEISYGKNLSHLGSCLSSVDIIDMIYKIKHKEDKFVLSNGHAGIALYAVLEKNGLIKNLKALEKLYIHPDRNPKIGIDVSTGSLGQGLPIALGLALSNKQRNAYCIISDGECTEGSIWESLRIATDYKIRNLKIVVNANGWGAYGSISTNTLLKRLRAFGCTVTDVDGHNKKALLRILRKKSRNKPLVIFAKTKVEQFNFLRGQDAHYYKMSKKDYNKALEILK